MVPVYTEDAGHQGGLCFVMVSVEALLRGA